MNMSQSPSLCFKEVSTITNSYTSYYSLSQVFSDMVPAFIWTGKALSSIWRQDPEVTLLANVLGVEFQDVSSIACDVLYVDSYTRTAFTLYTLKEPIGNFVGKGVDVGELKVRGCWAGGSH